MDIYIGYISPLYGSANDDQTEYSVGKGVLKARHANEATCKFVVDTLKKEGNSLDKLICIISPGVLGEGLDKSVSYNYFKNSVREYGDIPEEAFVPVLISQRDEASGSIDGLFSELSQRILGFAQQHGGDITIHLDISGGRRNVVILIQLLTKLLSYYGFSSSAYYAEKSGSSGKVINYSSSYRQMELLDAVNEFVTHGSTVQLSRLLLSDNGSAPLNRLIRSMQKLSETIKLCRTGKLASDLQELRSAVTNFNSVSTKTGEELLVGLILPLIEQKFFGCSGEPDIFRIIRWCLENDLIQQALTIYSELVPAYIFERGLILQHDKLFEDIKGYAENSYDSVHFKAISRILVEHGAPPNNNTLKFKAAFSLCAEKMPFGSVLNIPKEEFRLIVAELIALKQVRNAVNHANSELSQYPDFVSAVQQRLGLATYKQNGFTAANISTDLLRAVERLEGAAACVSASK